MQHAICYICHMNRIFIIYRNLFMAICTTKQKNLKNRNVFTSDSWIHRLQEFWKETICARFFRLWPFWGRFYLHEVSGDQVGSLPDGSEAGLGWFENWESFHVFLNQCNFKVFLWQEDEPNSSENYVSNSWFRSISKKYSSKWESSPKGEHRKYYFNHHRLASS